MKVVVFVALVFAVLVAAQDSAEEKKPEQSNYGTWLADHGLQPSLNEIKVKPGQKKYAFHANGRNMIVTQPIQKGELVLQYPLDSAFSGKELDSIFTGEAKAELNKILYEDEAKKVLENNDRLILSLVFHKFLLREASPFAQYLNTLSGPQALSTQMPFWSEAAVAEIPEGLSILKIAHENLVARIEDLIKGCEVYFAVQDPGKTQEDIGKVCGKINFQWAAAIALSRSWQAGDDRGAFLLPYIDLFDHSASGPQLTFVGDEANTEQETQESELKYVQIFANRDYAAGEEFAISYHPPRGGDNTYSTASMVMNYGFLPERSEWIMKITVSFAVKSLFDFSIKAMRELIGCNPQSQYDFSTDAEGSDSFTEMVKCLRTEAFSIKDYEHMSLRALRENKPLVELFDETISVENEFIVLARLLNVVAETEKLYPSSLEEDQKRIASAEERGDVKLILAARMSNKIVLNNMRRVIQKQWLKLLEKPFDAKAQAEEEARAQQEAADQNT